MRRLAVFIILNQHRGRELLTNLPAPIFFVIKVSGEKSRFLPCVAAKKLAISHGQEENLSRGKLAFVLGGEIFSILLLFVITSICLVSSMFTEKIILIESGH